MSVKLPSRVIFTAFILLGRQLRLHCWELLKRELYVWICISACLYVDEAIPSLKPMHMLTFYILSYGDIVSTSIYVGSYLHQSKLVLYLSVCQPLNQSLFLYLHMHSCIQITSFPNQHSDQHQTTIQQWLSCMYSISTFTTCRYTWI